MSGAQSRRHREAWPLVHRGLLVDQVGGLLAERTVVVSGTAGIGKTGLATLVGRTWGEAGRTVVWVGAGLSGRDVPFSAFAAHAVAGDAAGMGDRDPATGVAGAVRTALGPPANRPLLVVDDAQWLDAGSATVTRRLIAEGTRVLATVRTGEPGADDWLALVDDGVAAGIDVTAADRGLCEAIVREVLGGQATAALVDRLHERSSGNLLFLRELLLAGLDSGAVTQRGRRWELHADLPADDDLAGAVSRRLRSLDDAERAALGALAVLEPISDDLFGCLPDAEHVPELERRGFVDASPTGMLRVSHPLIAAAARTAGPVSRRRRELDRVTEAVLAKLDDHGSDLALRLVTLRTDHDLLVPARSCTAAAARAFALLDHELATRLGQAAVAVDPADVEAQLVVGAALSAQFRTEEAEPHLRAALAAARTDSQRARAAGRLGLHLGIRVARPDEALTVMRAALDRIEDPAWRSFLSADIGKIELLSGRGDGTGGATDGGEEPVARLNQSIMGGLVAALAADVTASEHHVATGLALAPDHVGVLPNGGDLLRLAQFVARLAAGDVAGAEELARTELAACAAGRSEPEGMWLALLATGALATGRPERAVEQATAAIPLVAVRDFVGGLHPGAQAVRAVALAQLGRADEAVDQLDAIDTVWHTDPRTAATMLQARAWLDHDPDRLVAAARSAVDAGLVAAGLPIAYDAVRLGHPAAAEALLATIAELAPASVAVLFTAHAAAAERDDVDGLLSVADALERLGMIVFAAEARAGAAAVAGVTDPRRGRWLLAEARELLRRSGTATSPRPELAVGDGDEDHEQAGALTDRQLEIARLAAARWRSREIADHLGLSTRTVDNQLGRIYKLLDVASRDELAAVLHAGDAGRE
jgi:DNA-binding CsgD family transcriptional regulator